MGPGEEAAPGLVAVAFPDEVIRWVASGVYDDGPRRTVGIYQ